MSRGPGKVERQIAAVLLAAGPITRDDWLLPYGVDRVFTVADLCREVFGAGEPSRAQRISVLRAAHRALRRSAEVDRLKTQAWREACADAEAKFGEDAASDPGYARFMREHPAMKRRREMPDGPLRRWRATTRKDGTVVLHDDYHPIRVWAVQVQPEGVVWSEDVEIVSITKTRVNIRYGGELASLDRANLARDGAWWRAVRFLSNRRGWGAWRMEQQWDELYGHLFPDRLPLDRARRLLGLLGDYDREAVIAAFRRMAKLCHPDLGGTAEKFRELVIARDRLLAAIGTSAPAPKEPTFWSKGSRIVYRSIGSRRQSQLSGGRTKRLT